MTLLSRILTISKPPNLRSEAVGLDVVGASQLPRRIRRLIAAEAGMQPLADDLAVQDIDDLEAAELEPVDTGLHFALHGRGHDRSPGMMCRSQVRSVATSNPLMPHLAFVQA